MVHCLIEIYISFYLACSVLHTTALLSNSNSINGPNFDVQNANALYKAFIRKYHRKFRDEDDYYQRYLNFVETLRTINKINSQNINEKVGPNQFADWSDDERHKRMEKLKKTGSIDPDLKAVEDAKALGPKIELVFPGSDTYLKYMKGFKLQPEVSSYDVARRFFS